MLRIRIFLFRIGAADMRLRFGQGLLARVQLSGV